MDSPVDTPLARAIQAFRWRWFLFAVALGAILITLLMAIARGDLPHTTQIPHTDTVIFVGVLAFVLTGILVGFTSPGRTIAEAGIAGLVLAIIGEAVAIRTFEAVHPIWLILGIWGGFSLGLGGGWVGELLQGTLDDPDARRGKLQWPWVGAGVFLGVLLSSLFVVLGRAIFAIDGMGVLIGFSVSFLVTGFFVGVCSPGITLLEPALAGLGAILVDALVLAGGLGAFFPVLGILIAGMGAFVLALVGGWIGEVIQAGWHRVHPVPGGV